MSTDRIIIPKEPEKPWLEQFFLPSLLSTNPYKIDTPEVEVKLDQNESPWDWPPALKQRILDRVRAKSWNRYPESYGVDLHHLLGSYVGVSPECLLTSPGSNALIPLIIDTMGRNVKGKVVIARPSFALFEMHCQYAGISYEPWNLNKDFEYDLASLPPLPEQSLVVFASPNNPTGTSLDINLLDKLLGDHPRSMFLADEAYFEFNDQPYIELLQRHSNLMILRTMSKTMGAAGIRLGYLIGAAPLIAQLKKVRLPYLLNHFAMEAAKVILSDPEMQEFVQNNVRNAIAERESVRTKLIPLAKANNFRVIPSKANFLLLQWQNQQSCQEAYHNLVKNRVLVRNISGGPGLAGCLRVSIGTQDENEFFLRAMQR